MEEDDADDAFLKMSTIATFTQANSKDFLKESDRIKHIETLNDTYYILTDKGNLFKATKTGAQNTFKPFASSTNRFSYFTILKQSLKNTVPTIIAANRNNQLIIPTKQTNNDQVEQYSEPVRTKRICDSNIHQLKVTTIEQNTFAFVGSSWPNIYYVKLPKNNEDANYFDRDPKKYQKEKLLDNAYLLDIITDKNGIPYIIYGQITDTKKPSFRSVKTAYCNIDIYKQELTEKLLEELTAEQKEIDTKHKGYQKLPSDDNNPQTNYQQTADLFNQTNEAYLLATFTDVHVNGSQVPIWIDYQNDDNFTCFAYTKSGYQLKGKKNTIDQYYAINQSLNDILGMKRIHKHAYIFCKDGYYELALQEQKISLSDNISLEQTNETTLKPYLTDDSKKKSTATGMVLIDNKSHLLFNKVNKYPFIRFFSGNEEAELKEFVNNNTDKLEEDEDENMDKINFDEN